MGLFSGGPKNELETAMISEPPSFEPLKVYCIYIVFYNQMFQKMLIYI